MTEIYRHHHTYVTVGRMRRRWMRFWLKFAGPTPIGRISARLVGMTAPPHKAAAMVAQLHPRGFITPSATVYHADLRMGRHVLIGDRVVLYQNTDGGPMHLGDRVAVLRDCALETGWNGSLDIGARTWIQPRCQINAYVGAIHIGSGVDMAPGCALYSYDHGFKPGRTIREQPLQSKGDIVIGDDVWLGYGVIVLSGVSIGKGAVIGAGALVSENIPDHAIAVGQPAKVVKMRSDL